MGWILHKRVCYGYVCPTHFEAVNQEFDSNK